MRHIQEICVIRVEGDGWGFDMRASTVDGDIVFTVAVPVDVGGVCGIPFSETAPKIEAAYYHPYAGH
jgi:hypothetical protein